MTGRTRDGASVLSVVNLPSFHSRHPVLPVVQGDARRLHPTIMNFHLRTAGSLTGWSRGGAIVSSVSTNGSGKRCALGSVAGGSSINGPTSSEPTTPTLEMIEEAILLRFQWHACFHQTGYGCRSDRSRTLLFAVISISLRRSLSDHCQDG